MLVNLKNLRKALEHLHYHCPTTDESDVIVSIQEENIQDGKLCDYLTLTVHGTREARSYDSVQSERTVTTCIEVFSSSENRPSQLTVSESQMLRT